MSKQQTAVLFFSRSAKAEGAQKKFAGKKESKNHALAHSLIEHSYRQIRSADYPVFSFDEHQQKGNTFGERISYAFQQVFDKGYDYVIAVGNDTPQLAAQHITKAGNALKKGDADIVLGPAADGGTWLMGYCRKNFEAASFELLPWSTSALFEAILEQSGHDTAITLFDELADIDDTSSLTSFLENRPFNSVLLNLIHFIKAVLASEVFAVSISNSFCLPNPIFSGNSLRAPPLA